MFLFLQDWYHQLLFNHLINKCMNHNFGYCRSRMIDMRQLYMKKHELKSSEEA